MISNTGGYSRPYFSTNLQGRSPLDTFPVDKLEVYDWADFHGWVKIAKDLTVLGTTVLDSLAVLGLTLLHSLVVQTTLEVKGTSWFLPQVRIAAELPTETEDVEAALFVEEEGTLAFRAKGQAKINRLRVGAQDPGGEDEDADFYVHNDTVLRGGLTTKGEIHLHIGEGLEEVIVTGEELAGMAGYDSLLTVEDRFEALEDTDPVAMSVKLTNINYNSGTDTTHISHNTQMEHATFTGTLNGISTTVFSYLSNLTGDVQDVLEDLIDLGTAHTTDISALQVKTTQQSHSGSTTTFANTLASSVFTFSTSLNGLSPTVVGYLSGVTSSIQTQLNTLFTRTTALGYTSGTTSISDTTESTSLTTGSLVTVGGIGVAKRATVNELTVASTTGTTAINGNLVPASTCLYDFTLMQQRGVCPSCVSLGVGAGNLYNAGNLSLNNISIGTGAGASLLGTTQAIPVAHGGFIGIGHLAGNAYWGQTNSTYGDGLIAIGKNAAVLNRGVIGSIAIGSESLSSLPATVASHRHTAVGMMTMQFYNTTLSGNDGNSCFGNSAMRFMRSGKSNTAMGASALLGTTSSTGVSENTVCGFQSFTAVTTGATQNSAVGVNTGLINTSGSQNSFFGYNSGASNTTGNNNLLLGQNAGTSSSAVTVTTQNNLTVIGNNSTTDAHLHGNLNLYGPTSTLTVAGSSSNTTVNLFNTLAAIVNLAGAGVLNVNNFTFAGTFNGLSTTVVGYLSGVTSAIQTQLNTLSSRATALETKTTAQSYSGTTTTFANTVATSILTFATSLNGVTPTVFGYLSGVTSAIQTQLNTLFTRTTDQSYSGTTTTFANTVATSLLTFATSLNGVTPTVFGYLSGVTSAIQTQLNALSSRATALETKTTDQSYSGTTTTFANTVATSILTFATSLNGITPTVFGYLSGVTSAIQTQLNALSSRATALETKTTDQSYSGTTTTFANTVATSILTFATSLNGITPTVFGYLSGVTSAIQTQLNTLSSRATALETKTTDQTYSSTTTTFANTVATSIFTFATSLNGITPTVFGYLSGVTSAIQTQLNTLFTRTTDQSYSGTTTTFANTVATSIFTFATSLNGITPTVFGYLSGVTSAIQTQLNALSSRATALETKTTDQSYSGTTTTFANTVATSIFTFATTLNGITPTVFGYLSGVTSAIQTQLNSLSSRTTLLETKTAAQNYSSSVTTFNNTVATSILTFAATLNGITPTVFGYLSGVTSAIQTQLNTLFTRTTDQSYSGTTTTFANTVNTSILTFSTSLNGVTPAAFSYMSGATGDIQDQIDDLDARTDVLETKTTDQSYSGTTTTFANTLASSLLTFATSLNGITPTVFGYLSGVTSSIQGQFFTLQGLTANMFVIGNITVFTGPLVTSDTTDSTAINNGALISYGGLGVAKTAVLNELTVMSTTGLTAINGNFVPSSTCLYDFTQMQQRGVSPGGVSIGVGAGNLYNAGNLSVNNISIGTGAGASLLGTTQVTPVAHGGFIGIGHLAGNAYKGQTNPTYGDGAIVIGKNAMSINQGVIGSIAIGSEVLSSLPATVASHRHTAVGMMSMRFFNAQFSGNDANTALGSASMGSMRTGKSNTAMGASALQGTTSSTGVSENTVCGFQSFMVVTTGATQNSAVGVNTGVANTSGSQNSFFGYNSGASNTTGSNNLLLGQNAGTSSSAATVTTQSNLTVVGNNSTTDAYIHGNPRFYGTTSTLTVDGSASNTTVTLFASATTLLNLALNAANIVLSKIGALVTFKGSVTVDQNLSVSGTSSLVGNVTANGNISGLGTGHFNGDLATSANLAGNNLALSGDITGNGNFIKIDTTASNFSLLPTPSNTVTLAAGAGGLSLNKIGGTTTVKGGLAVDQNTTVTGTTTLTGNVTCAADIAVNGGDITTTSSTFNIANATATTVAMAGAATTTLIGNSSYTNTSTTTYNPSTKIQNRSPIYAPPLSGSFWTDAAITGIGYKTGTWSITRSSNSANIGTLPYTILKIGGLITIHWGFGSTAGWDGDDAVKVYVDTPLHASLRPKYDYAQAPCMINTIANINIANWTMMTRAVIEPSGSDYYLSFLGNLVVSGIQQGRFDKFATQGDFQLIPGSITYLAADDNWG